MTVLMPSWYYEKKDLKRCPSILDGLHPEKESRYRKEGARFIINVGTKMGLRYDTMATGVVYFHRFYMFHSFKTFPRYVTACCCLFLAGKVEETPKKCKDIIKTAKSFLADTQFTQFGDDPGEEVMTLERILLQTIKFDLQVDHPYGHLLKYAKSLKGDEVKLQKLVQMAWTFINDSLCTTLCLQFEPEVIAIALIHLAGKLSKFDVVDWIGRTSKHGHWWDMFGEGITVELLEDICHQVLDLYSIPMSDTPQDSPPATPPTKSTRRTSQPPSPTEASTSPVQIKAKEVIGQPIPRLEPGELKRKIPDAKKEHSENKIPRILEGKPITTITSSPKSNSNQGSDTRPSSPSSPPVMDNVSKTPELPIPRNTTDTYRINPTKSQPYAHVIPTILQETVIPKPVSQTIQTPTTSYPLTVPLPTATYTQSAPPYYTGVSQETPPYPTPNMQQPPPQIYTPRSLQFQHPPPPVASPGTLPSMHHPPPTYVDPPYTTGPTPTIPAFNAQYPPPRHQPPPSLLSNPPPGPLPPGLPQHPPPPAIAPNIRPPHRNPLARMPSDSVYGSRSDIYPEQRAGLLATDHKFVGPRGRFDGDSPRFRGRRGLEFDPSFRLPPPGQYGQERPPIARRFPLENQASRKLERTPPRPGMPSVPQQGASSTGIPPVRITGSMI